MVRPEIKDETITTASVINNGISSADEQLLPEVPALREEVDSMIEQGMTDLWLLLAGEGLAARPYSRNRDGKPFAMIFNGQMHLLGAKPAALDALRSVGLDLALNEPQYEG